MDDRKKYIIDILEDLSEEKLNELFVKATLIKNKPVEIIPEKPAEKLQDISNNRFVQPKYIKPNENRSLTVAYGVNMSKLEIT